jgi:hypothetical protein
MRIYSISLLPDQSIFDTLQTPLEHVSSISACLQEAKTLFESLLAVPLSEYRSYSVVEWSRFILSVIVPFQTCVITPTVPGWTDSHEKLPFGVYLESLSFRMGELSKTDEDNTGPPDIFCMFKSVLKVVREMYQDLERSVAQDNLQSDPMSAFRCPIFGSAITDTDYWGSLKSSNANGCLENANFSTGVEGLDLFSQLENWDSWDTGIKETLVLFDPNMNTYQM